MLCLGRRHQETPICSGSFSVKPRPPTRKAAPNRPKRTNPHHSQETWGPPCTCQLPGIPDMRNSPTSVRGCAWVQGMQCTFPAGSCSPKKESDRPRPNTSTSSQGTQVRGWCPRWVSTAPSGGSDQEVGASTQESCRPPGALGHTKWSGCAGLGVAGRECGEVPAAS